MSTTTSTMRWVTLALALSLFGCDGEGSDSSETRSKASTTNKKSKAKKAKKAKKEKPGPRKTLSPEECSKRVASLEKQLGVFAAEVTLEVDEKIQVPRFDSMVGNPVSDVTLVVVEAGGTMTVAGAVSNDLETSLKRVQTLWKSFHPNETRKVWHAAFTVDATLPVARLAPAVEAARTAGWTPSLLVRVPNRERVDAKGPPWVDKVLERARQPTLSSADRVKVLDEGIRRVAESCTDLTKALNAVSAESVDPNQRGKLLTDIVPEAVKSCACDTDVDALAVLLLERLGGGAQYRLFALPDKLPQSGTVEDIAKK